MLRMFLAPHRILALQQSKTQLLPNTQRHAKMGTDIYTFLHTIGINQIWDIILGNCIQNVQAWQRVDKQQLHLSSTKKTEIVQNKAHTYQRIVRNLT